MPPYFPCWTRCARTFGETAFLVFWGVAFPWAICLLFSVWFCFAYMADDDLGQDPEEGGGHA